MRKKEGVVLSGLQIVMRPVLIEVDRIYKKYSCEAVITSGLDGMHSPGSLHYYGYALDFRISFFTEKELNLIVDELRDTLGSAYDVILEKSHLHIEYDAILE